MRISNNTIFENVKRNLAMTIDALVDANNVVSTGKRINQLSDDPIGLANVLDLRMSLANVDQIERNINMGQSWLSAGETALSQTQDILSSAKSLAVEMGSASKTASQRSAAGTAVDGYLRQILSLANTEVNGRYIFSGTDTDKQSFSFDDETNPTTVTYNGNDTAFSVKIGKDLDIQVGRDGQEVFGTNWDGYNIFKTLIDFKNSLQNNDVSGIQAAIGNLDAHMAVVTAKVADTGTRTTRLDVKQNILEELKINYTDRKSSIEDADITEAVINLKAKELAYQSALASSSKVMELSLVDYLA
jgi:flagellar hook-associated protein 3 FlgL